jgi:replication factor C small subunit
MLIGPAGGGKTSLAKIIVDDILKCEYLFLNCSEQNSIDTVKGIITNFIQTKSFNGQMKVVVLDEADGLSRSGGSGSSAQKALRNILEEYADHSRFIFTCNFGQDIIEPIHSRLQTFYICPDRQEFIKRCLVILKQENIILPAEHKLDFMRLIDKHYPDLRKTLNELQKFSYRGVFKPSENVDEEIMAIATHCFKLLRQKVDIVDIRKYIITNEQKFKSDYNILLKDLFENVYSSDLDMNKKKTIILIISEALYYNQIVLDKEINYFATCIKIGNIL